MEAAKAEVTCLYERLQELTSMPNVAHHNGSELSISSALTGRRLESQPRVFQTPIVELSDANEELPSISLEIVNTLDAARLIEFLGQVQEPYRAAISLFYMEDYSYKEIAGILEIPLGTVRSRISRGVAQLKQSILIGSGAQARRRCGQRLSRTQSSPARERLGNCPALVA